MYLLDEHKDDVVDPAFHRALKQMEDMGATIVDDVKFTEQVNSINYSEQDEWMTSFRLDLRESKAQSQNARRMLPLLIGHRHGEIPRRLRNQSARTTYLRRRHELHSTRTRRNEPQMGNGRMDKMSKTC